MATSRDRVAMTRGDARAIAGEIFAAAVAAALPGPAVRRALRSGGPPRGPVHVVALGKAAGAMAEAAVARLAALGLDPAGGVVVSSMPLQPIHPALSMHVGDHPLPGPESKRAAAEIESAARQVSCADECWVLLSGGTSSLVAAPIDGVTPGDLRALFDALLRSGLDITRSNRVRKQFLQWGGGRLAAALAPARMRVLIASDVLGDDPAIVASGPCSPDEGSTGDVARLLESLAERRLLGADAAGRLNAVLTHPIPLLQPADDVFACVDTRIVAGIGGAVAGALSRGASLGLEMRAGPRPLEGEAAAAGRAIVARAAAEPLAGMMRGTVFGGETTVSLGGDGEAGGRCQELALAAAAAIAGRSGLTLLAGGTDGRDGPTDAAGAVVDGSTWEAMRKAGRDPAHDLAAHRSHDALDAAGALLRTGPTGTNVGDLVVLLEG